MRFQAGVQIILIIVAAAIIMLVVRPELDEIQTKQDNLSELNNAIEKADTYNRALGEKLSVKNSFPTADLVALDRYVPANINASRIARDIANMTEGSGLILQDVTVGESQSANVESGSRDSEEVPGVVVGSGGSLQNEIRNELVGQLFTVEAIGTYESMKTLMQSIERNAYPLRVVRVEFTQESDTGSSFFVYRIELQAFALSATSNNQ